MNQPIVGGVALGSEQVGGPGGGGAVSKIIAGTNVSISSTGAGGTGDVTVNAAAGGVSPARLINTTAPITGGGDLSADRSLAIAVATAVADGYLSAADWIAFSAKVAASRSIGVTAPLTGGGDLSANRVIAMAGASAGVDGYLKGTDWTAFNNKMTNVLTQNGSLITRVGGVVTELPVGATPDGSILGLVGGIPAWVAFTGVVDSGSIVGTGTTTLNLDGNSDYLLAFQWKGNPGAGLQAVWRFNGLSSDQGCKSQTNGDTFSTATQAYCNLGGNGLGNVIMLGAALISCKSGINRGYTARISYGRTVTHQHEASEIVDGGWNDNSTALVSADIVVVSGAFVAPSRWALYRRAR